jgi:uncharacterized protein GlcG (DUF336 family)
METPRCFLKTVRGLLLSIVFVPATVVYPQPVMQPNVSVAQAQKIIAAIIAECSRPGDLVTVSVAVVDRAGQPVMQVKADTGHPHNWELSFRKAYTARTFRRPTSEWKERTAGESPVSGQRMLEHVIPVGGGMPIMMGDQPVGAVGVTGAPGGVDGDEACARLGVDAVASEFQSLESGTRDTS